MFKTGKELEDALDKIANDLGNMPKAEWDAMMAKEDRLMREAIISGTEHLGYTLWYMKDPEAAQNWADMVLDDHKKLCTKMDNKS